MSDDFLGQKKATHRPLENGLVNLSTTLSAAIERVHSAIDKVNEAMFERRDADQSLVQVCIENRLTHLLQVNHAAVRRELRMMKQR